MKTEKLKRAAAVAAFPLVAILGWVVVADRAAANGRVVHVVNATPAAAQVQLSPSETLKLAPGQTAEVALPEGSHTVRVELEGEAPESIDVTIEGTLLERFLDKTAFVINVGGRATLRWEEEEYGKRPSGRLRPARVFFGERFLRVEDVDFAFTPFPEKINSNDDVITRTRLGVVMAPPAEIAASFPGDDPRGLDYCEGHLSPARPDEKLLSIYLRLGRTQSATERLVAFLANGLEPLWIPWHRAYQDAQPDRATLAKAYTERLAADPQNPDLLYLCGRIAAPEKGLELYRRAVAADPKHGFANHALAVRLARRADYEAALPHTVAACAARPDDVSMLALNHEIRFALGEFDALETELKARLKKRPVDLATLKALLEVQAALGAMDRARESAQTYRQEVSSRLPQDPQQLALHAELLLSDLEGKHEQTIKLAEQLTAKHLGARLAFNASLANGDPALAEKLMGETPWTGVAGLLLSMAWDRAQEPEKAKAWRAKAIEAFAAGGAAERTAAGLLKGGADVDPALVTGLALSPAAKCVVLTALGGRCADAAKPFDTSLYFPHTFLQQS